MIDIQPQRVAELKAGKVAIKSVWMNRLAYEIYGAIIKARKDWKRNRETAYRYCFWIWTAIGNGQAKFRARDRSEETVVLSAVIIGCRRTGMVFAPLRNASYSTCRSQGDEFHYSWLSFSIQGGSRLFLSLIKKADGEFRSALLTMIRLRSNQW